LLKPGINVVDLGAAPGGWSQIAIDKVGEAGRVFALDILEMDPIAGVEFIQGDFTEDEVYQQLLDLIGNDRVDLVISDMAPNMSGMASVDQPRAMYLLELALDMARQVLSPGGRFVAKAFQGEGYEPWIKDLRTSFKTVQIRKPKSSRARSREVYVLANDFHQ
jgi:23S rRNA (uridine2552-2'-O)-methyltransferase